MLAWGWFMVSRYCVLHISVFFWPSPSQPLLVCLRHQRWGDMRDVSRSSWDGRRPSVCQTRQSPSSHSASLSCTRMEDWMFYICHTMGCLQQKLHRTNIMMRSVNKFSCLYFSYPGLEDDLIWNSFWAIFLKAYLRQVVILRLLVYCILVDGDVTVSINSVLCVN